jgi:hypothetical protein
LNKAKVMDLLFVLTFTYYSPMLLTINLFWRSLLGWVFALAIPLVHVGLCVIGIHIYETFDGRVEMLCLEALHFFIYCIVPLLS